MKENKNLDKLFQDKFKSLDYSPQEIVWENIEEQLKEKKKKRVIPFWWKLSGVAAVFFLGLGLYTIAFDNNNSSNNSVVDSNDNSIISTNPNGKNELKDGTIRNNDVVVIKESNSKNSVLESNNNSIKSSKNEIIKTDDDIIVLKTSSKNNASQVEISKDNILKNKVLTSKKTDSKIASTSKNENELNNITTNKNKAIANKSNSEKSKIELENKTNYFNNTDKNSAIVNNTENSNALNDNKNIISNKIENKITSNETIKDVVINQEEIKKIDSTSIASVVPNAMEELLNEKEKKTIKEPKLNRWQLSSNVAPIFFSSSSNGSPLDSKFKDNTKQFNTNIGYGIGVKYAVNKKVKIRTGINSLVADYNTNDIVVYQNVNASKIEHVDSNLRGSIIQVENKTEQTTQTLEPNGNLMKKYDSSLNQKIGYIEIPLELSYKLIDKKIGVEVIGGVSSLFLNQNEVSVITSGTEMSIGKANNLNSIHFSGNLGLGLKYNIWKKIEAHVEPIFKYQVNTFANDSGNFKPYIFGVYSGLSYTF